MKKIPPPDEPMYQRKIPYLIKAAEGEPLAICRCGHSKRAPLCDGSHVEQPGNDTPLAYTPERDETLYVCGCGGSKSMPWCDGKHEECPWW
ncbi:MAG: CDGSH iron-sulfur domain-containing protein [Magnetococcales bacterium]|nr:CDGSH iron-sulfur domain-containing protein [Magnetococcales bacterium]